MLGRLAELFVDIRANSTPFEAGLGRIQGQIGEMGASLGALAARAAATFAAMAAGAAAIGIFKAVNAAGDLNEALDKVDSVFGEASQTVKAFADDYAKRFGKVKLETLDGVSKIGLLGEAVGMTDEKAAELGIQFAKIAADVGSLNNFQFNDTLEKLRSGLAGEAEPLRALGVFISEDAVQAEALAMGLAKSAKEASNLTVQQKLLARIQLIAKAPAILKAKDNLELTANSYANLSNKMSGNFQNMLTDIGQAFLPFATRVIGIIGSMTTTVGNWLKENAAQFVEYGNKFLDFFESLGPSIGELVGELATALAPALKELFMLVGAVITTFTEFGVVTLTTVVIPAIKALAEALTMLMRGLRSLLEAMQYMMGYDPAARTVRGVRVLGAELDAAKAKADALAKAMNPGGPGAAKAAGVGANRPLKVEVIRDDTNDIGPNSTLSPEERLRQGLGLKPGEMERARRVPKPPRPSEYFDFVGFNRMVQANLSVKKDDPNQLLVTTIHGVTFEIEKQTAELTRIGAEQNAQQRELNRRLQNGVYGVAG